MRPAINLSFGAFLAIASFSVGQNVIPLGPGCGFPEPPMLSMTPPLVGRPVTFTVGSSYPFAPGFFVLSLPGGVPIVFPGTGCTVYIDLPSYIPIPLWTDANGDWSMTFDVPMDPSLAGLALAFQARVCAGNGPLLGDHVSNAFVGVMGMPPICLLIIDEDTIDNGISTIIGSAASHNVTSAHLVNDDIPTEVGNPWLRWNSLFPGDIVVLPGGRTSDEGLFAPPPAAPWSLAAFADGAVPQNQLDQIADVMPLRNHALAALKGTTCVAVVYDSDIGMNYNPIKGNLQGGRLGRFAFTVLDVVVPGTIPESMSSTSLYDLVVRVEPPLTHSFGYVTPILQHSPDSIQITLASWNAGTLTVRGTSQYSPTAVMTVSVAGFVFEAPMTWHAPGGYYRYIVSTPTNLDGRRVTISTDKGGAYNAFVQ